MVGADRKGAAKAHPPGWFYRWSASPAPCSCFPWDPVLSPLSEPPWARPLRSSALERSLPLTSELAAPGSVSHTDAAVLVTELRDAHTSGLRHELTEDQPLQGDALGIPKSRCTLINQLKLLHTTWLG